PGRHVERVVPRFIEISEESWRVGDRRRGGRPIPAQFTHFSSPAGGWIDLVGLHRLHGSLWCYLATIPGPIRGSLVRDRWNRASDPLDDSKRAFPLQPARSQA